MVDRMIISSQENSLLTVDPHGGKVVLTLRNIPILISTHRADGKTGVTHLCTPLFGPDHNHIYGIPQHGSLRNQEVSLEKRNDHELVLRHEISEENYPKGVMVELVMNLTDSELHLRLTHTNTGTQEAAVNAGLHFYFDAPEGYQGTLVNSEDISKMIADNPTGGLISLRESNRIQIPGKPETILKQQGFHKAMTWVSRNPETGVIDTNYVCIEPVEHDPTGDFFGSAESMIQPGESRLSECTLSLS